MIWQATRAGCVRERIVVGLGHEAAGVTGQFVDTNIAGVGQGWCT